MTHIPLHKSEIALSIADYLISRSLPTCKFDVEFILGLQNLDVEGAVWSKVFHSPCSEDGLVILRKLETESGEINAVAQGEKERDRE